MHFLEKFYSTVTNYELINKFTYKSTKTLPKLEKIILNFGCKTADIKQLSSSLLALELISNQKAFMNKTRRSNILLKIRKGNPTGCKITLRKLKAVEFILKTLIEVFPKLKNFSGFNACKKLQKRSFSYNLTETFSFLELERYYYLFNNLPQLDVTVVVDSKTHHEIMFLLKSLKFPFKN